MPLNLVLNFVGSLRKINFISEYVKVKIKWELKKNIKTLSDVDYVISVCSADVLG